MNTVGALTGPTTSGAGSLLSGAMNKDTIGGLQAGSSFLSGLGAMGAGTSKAASYKIQAGEWGTQAGDEFVSGQNQVTGLKSQYLSAVGGATAKLAAGGVDVGQGVGQTSRDIVGQNEANTGRVDMLASDIRSRRDQINVIQANEAAKQADEAGQLGLIGGILGGGLKLLSAGVL